MMLVVMVDGLLSITGAGVFRPTLGRRAPFVATATATAGPRPLITS